MDTNSMETLSGLSLQQRSHREQCCLALLPMLDQEARETQLGPCLWLQRHLHKAHINLQEPVALYKAACCLLLVKSEIFEINFTRTVEGD
jgi:hypothetical protein